MKWLTSFQPRTVLPWPNEGRNLASLMNVKIPRFRRVVVLIHTVSTFNGKSGLLESEKTNSTFFAPRSEQGKKQRQSY